MKPARVLSPDALSVPVIVVLPRPAAPVVSKVEAPMSIAPKPEVMEPEFNAPTVTKLESPVMWSGVVEEK